MRQCQVSPVHCLDGSKVTRLGTASLTFSNRQSSTAVARRAYKIKLISSSLTAAPRGALLAWDDITAALEVMGWAGGGAGSPLRRMMLVGRSFEIGIGGIDRNPPPSSAGIPTFQSLPDGSRDRHVARAQGRSLAAGLGLLVLRLFVGVAFLRHGWPKLRNLKTWSTAKQTPEWLCFLSAGCSLRWRPWRS